MKCHGLGERNLQGDLLDGIFTFFNLVSSHKALAVPITSAYVWVNDGKAHLIQQVIMKGSNRPRQKKSINGRNVMPLHFMFGRSLTFWTTTNSDD